MVKLRLKRMGSKFRPVYKIVAADARAPRDGKFIEALGHYNPSTKELVLNKEATDKWIKQGAKPTLTVANLLKSSK
ncbi:30S ribosomal protein S16 [Mycoplasma sp. CSL10137]|uniref:30S ribosomal protein S16 n=1 Tax=unclassified Mycoplasma TaxID=2683645 RepID=UPI00197B1AE3|nr:MULTISPECIES: 30S ribosomal protein S16 [unclassified Mycoplasma]MBN4083699.1 30S ribosomal protein S16 [Mycoplasma sp. CSL10137]MBN4084669.1 30S ribosomal protein S16 [Mycoplasma sp. CSL10166]MBU4693147.1 30S ribosomal protein S16 [Mycoplasma sp. CSL7491-lung]MCU4706659.1 30S ribosomal protein S16 [Mycoplasma sp. CSL7503-lung]